MFHVFRMELSGKLVFPSSFLSSESWTSFQIDINMHSSKKEEAFVFTVITLTQDFKEVQDLDLSNKCNNPFECVSTSWNNMCCRLSQISS